MYEWEVKLKKGTAIVHSEKWTKQTDGFYFWQYGHVVKQFSLNDVVSIQQVWPEVGELYENK